MDIFRVKTDKNKILMLYFLAVLNNLELFLLVPEIMDKLVKECVVTKAGADSYDINKQKVC